MLLNLSGFFCGVFYGTLSLCLFFLLDIVLFANHRFTTSNYRFDIFKIREVVQRRKNVAFCSDYKVPTLY